LRNIVLKGSKPGLIKKIQPVSVHGQLSLDVHFVDPDDPDGQVTRARIGPESIPGDLEPGDVVQMHFMLGVVTEITK
jgi:hypothetical protein